ncbi:MAG: HD domain-containing protein [Lentisphaeria bacterium]|nr:HD domain-containing protein [Lentisphaeria bacterium]
MIHSILIERLHESASIQRWNDFAKPVEFTELDKQAHKMIFAYVLARSAEDTGKKVNWTALIEGGVFECLHRVVLTDIKPHVFHQMMKEKGPELNRWVVSRLSRELAGAPRGFERRFSDYFLDSTTAPFEKRLLKAAHYLATQWEFRVIYKTCPFLYGIEPVKKDIEDQLAEHSALAGVTELCGEDGLRSFVDLCGQLRFQRRWSETPRVPTTTVLGHMLVVSVTSYLLILEFNPCPARARNAFFCGLFHDLPEVLTRDISSPVKNSVEGLDELIKEYERREMEDKLLPMLPQSWREEIRYYTENEFSNRARVGGRLRVDIPFSEFQADFNVDALSPVDGEMIRVCDHLAAFMEATLSIRHGITSRALRTAQEKLYAHYAEKSVEGLPVGRLFQMG